MASATAEESRAIEALQDALRTLQQDQQREVKAVIIKLITIRDNSKNTCIFGLNNITVALVSSALPAK